jgi:putative ABC transport system ATP-binding protein
MSIQTGELPLGRLPQDVADRTAIRAHELRKVYGSGDTAVAALDGVSVDFGWTHRPAVRCCSARPS